MKNHCNWKQLEFDDPYQIEDVQIKIMCECSNFPALQVVHSIIPTSTLHCTAVLYERHCEMSRFARVNIGEDKPVYDCRMNDASYGSATFLSVTNLMRKLSK